MGCGGGGGGWGGGHHLVLLLNFALVEESHRVAKAATE